jgi:hypothetical protein
MYLAGDEGLKVNWPVELRSQSKEEVVFHEPHKVSVILTTTYYAASRDSQMHQAVHYAT